jgi:hypothetical protein
MRTVKLRIACILLIIYFTLHTVASAANLTPVVRIAQGGLVYYGDTVDMRNIVGWTENISWWKSYDDPQADPPDHIITIRDFKRFNITKDMEPGYWYQWYGKNERVPSLVFFLVAKSRPETVVAPTPTPGILAPMEVARTQPKPIADYVVARYDAFHYDCMDACRIWLFGPEQNLLGADTDNGTFTINSVSLFPGTYTLMLQYPDANGGYEVFGDGDYLNSTWKDVPAVNILGLIPSLVQERFIGLVNDTAHFHGRIEQKKVIIEDQHIDVIGLDETNQGSVIISGQTNLVKGDIVKIVFDDDRVFLESDRRHNTFYANITGDDPGAYRIWQATLNVNLQTLPIGNHFIAVYPPNGEKTTVSFYLGEIFKPFQPPEAHIKYINNSPFIAPPPPVIITKEVPVTVVQTVVVHVTPAYSVVLQAQNETAETQRKIAEGNLIGMGLWGMMLCVLSVAGYKGGKYMIGVVKRARLV